MKTEIDNLTNNKENIVLVPGTKAATLFGKLLDKDRIISEDLEKILYPFSLRQITWASIDSAVIFTSTVLICSKSLSFMLIV